jgi:acyl-coenzyme A thioesterase PaaI-like protein
MLDDTMGWELIAIVQLVGRGRVVRKGRDVAFLAGELVDDQGKLVATATATAQIRRAAI